MKYEVLQIELYAGCFARAAALAVCKECAWVKGKQVCECLLCVRLCMYLKNCRFEIFRLKTFL